MPPLTLPPWGPLPLPTWQQICGPNPLPQLLGRLQVDKGYYGRRPVIIPAPLPEDDAPTTQQFPPSQQPQEERPGEQNEEERRQRSEVEPAHRPVAPQLAADSSPPSIVGVSAAVTSQPYVQESLNTSPDRGSAAARRERSEERQPSSPVQGRGELQQGREKSDEGEWGRDQTWPAHSLHRLLPRRVLAIMQERRKKKKKKKKKKARMRVLLASSRWWGSRMQ